MALCFSSILESLKFLALFQLYLRKFELFGGPVVEEESRSTAVGLLGGRVLVFWGLQGFRVCDFRV